MYVCMYVCICVCTSLTQGLMGQFQPNLVRIIYNPEKSTGDKKLLATLGAGWEGITCKYNRKQPLLVSNL